MFNEIRLNNFTLSHSLLNTFSLSTTSTLFISSNIVAFKDEVSYVFSFIMAWILASASLYGFFPNRLVSETPNPNQ